MSVKTYTAQEVADMLKVHINTIRSWIKSGKLNAMKLSDRLYRVSEEELNEFLLKENNIKK